MKILWPFQVLGHWALGGIARLGRSTLFLMRVLGVLFKALGRPRLIIEEMYSIGVLSLLIIAVSGLFVGMVLALQGYVTLVKFNAVSSLGVVVALSLVRELGPVLTALLFAGRAGSALTAEIGLMNATEQLSAMEMMATDPYRRVLAPKFLAAFISVPLLSVIFIAVGIFGGYFIGVVTLGVDSGIFWSSMHSAVSFQHDVLNGVFKSLAFGFVAAWVAVFNGMDAVPTPAGVSRATTRTVVNTSLLVLGLDFILTAIMFGGGL